MNKKVPARFWVETAMAAATCLALVLVLVRKDWIEAVLPVDPDQHSGLLESIIPVVLAALTVSFIALARHEWLGARPAVDTG